MPTTDSLLQSGSVDSLVGIELNLIDARLRDKTRQRHQSISLNSHVKPSERSEALQRIELTVFYAYRYATSLFYVPCTVLSGPIPH